MIRQSSYRFGALVLAVVLPCAGPPGAPGPVRAATGDAGAGEVPGDSLSLWDEPAFRRAVERSYKAETEIEPRVSVDEREQIQKVLDLISQEKMQKAIERLRELRSEDATAVFDFTLANIYFQREELDKAVAAYRVAVDKHPKFRRAWSNLGKIRTRRKNYGKAIEALTRVIELGGGDGLTYGLLGFSYTHAGDPLSAETAYRRAILLDADTMDWKMGLARSLFEQQRYAAAATHLGTLIEQNKERADLWKLQARAYIGLDKPRKAAENYEMIARLGEASFESLTTLGDIYVNEKLFGLAVDAYTRAMKADPDRKPQRAIRAAKVMAARGAYEQTAKLVDRIDARHADRLDDEQRKELLKTRARVAVARGADEEQARILERIVELDPTDGEALMLLAKHHQRAGEIEKAMFYYERAANVEGHEADAKVRHAQLLVRQDRYKDALKLLRAAQKIERRENVQTYLEQVERMARK